MKRSVCTAVMLLACCCFVFANGSKDLKTTSKETNEQKKITLTVWDFKSGEEVTGAAFREMDKMFMEKNPDIVINHVAQPEANYYELLTSAFTAKSDVDVVLSHTDNRAWNLKDFFMVLDPYIGSVEKDYSPAALQACSASKDKNKDIRMLPLTAQGIGFYYNRKLFRQAGLDASKAPVSWDDFFADCAALKKAGITPLILGNGGGSTYGIDFIYRTILAASYGERINGFSDGTANFTDPEFLDATRIIKKLYDNGYVNVENGSLPYFQDAINAFKAGKGAIFIGLTSDIAHWKDFGTALGYENVGYFSSCTSSKTTYPGAQVNQGAGLGLAVVSYCPNAEAAVKYVEFYTSGTGGKVFMDASGALVPNTTIPIDKSNTLLIGILTDMNTKGIPDFMNLIPGAMFSDMYNLEYLYFISKETDENGYIQGLEKLYKNSL